MEYRNEISNGYELGDLLWSGARTNLEEWLDKGADADDILSCVEEYLGYGEELPTLTEINDFLWFEPETVESYLGLSSDNEDEEIESACHGESKKRKTADERAKDEGADITASRKIQSMARGYLKPEYDSRASFYNKAETDDDKLYSYGTLVADIVDGEPVLYPDWSYSQTTIRHVREWLRQHGFEAGSKADIAAKYKVIQNNRKPVKSAGNPYAGMVRNPWGMKKQKSDMIDEITEDDISKAIETIKTSPESTWSKKLYSFGDGTSLYFAAGMGEGYDEDDVVCGKIACLPDNSAMSEYNYDFLMPYNPETSDVYDTDGELTQGSADWYNDAAKTIVEMINNGELVTK